MDLAEIDRSVESAFTAAIQSIWHRKLVFLAVAAITMAAGFLGMLALTPSYEGSTLLIGGQSGLEQGANGALKPVDTPLALTRIAESEEVVGAAIETVGLDRLVAGAKPKTQSIFARLRGRVFGAPASERALSPIESFLPSIKLGLTVRSELNSDVIRIAFRHRDPVVAALFANAVAQAFVDRQVELFSKPGAAEFFSRQQQRFEAEAKARADELDRFSVSMSVYAADDQKQLLLKRLNEVETNLAVARGTISQKLGERAALADELRKLAPVTRSPYVSSLVDTLAGDRGASPPRAGDARAIDERATDPPILLVKVYQDSMVLLFKINADLAGAQSLQKQQGEEITKLTTALNALANNEQQFGRLTRELDRANYNTDVYSKRMVEEQITAESRAARFSAVKVMQRATVPLRPASPNYIVMTVAVVAASGLLGAGATLLRPARRR